jgi:hypothetical protein
MPFSLHHDPITGDVMSHGSYDGLGVTNPSA